MLNCKESTHLLSEALDRPLGLSDRIALKTHLLTCRGCRNFRKQMHFLRQACQQWPGSKNTRDI